VIKDKIINTDRIYRGFRKRDKNSGIYGLRFTFLMNVFCLVIMVQSIIISCKEKNETGKITINFNHQVDGNNLRVDTMIYTNAAGNPFLITEVQYFISDIKLFKKDGTEILINEIHYVDTDIRDSWNWLINGDFPAGNYDSISFVFGIPDEKNISNSFVNPPESFMFWPDFLGGGYHYLKLNGKWLEAGQTTQTTPFNCHLGRGQVYFSYPDSIIGFIPNEFRVSLPGSSFEMSVGDTKQIHLTMSIDEWFKNPNIYDLDYWGSYTMQNQEAMQTLKENGCDVFTVLID